MHVKIRPYRGLRDVCIHNGDRLSWSRKRTVARLRPWSSDVLATKLHQDWLRHPVHDALSMCAAAVSSNSTLIFL